MNKVKSIIKDNAVKYMRYKDAFKTLKEPAFTEIYEYIEREFAALKCNVIFCNRDIDCAEMTEHYNTIGDLLISDINHTSQFLTPEQNRKFRAIHDYIHLTQGYGCDYEGEYNTYLFQSAGLSELSKQILYSEIVLQACFFLHFGNFPDVQKIVLLDIPNPEQSADRALNISINHAWQLDISISFTGRALLLNLIKEPYSFNEIWDKLLSWPNGESPFFYADAKMIGALTNAPIIGYKSFHWWLSNYEVFNEIEALLNGEIVRFQSTDY